MLPKGAFRLAYEEQLRLVPWPFKGYWKKLAAKNGYYNHTFMQEWANGLENEPVLEAGCGQSSEMTRREKKMHHLTGIDPLPDDLMKNEGLERKVVGVVEELPFEDGEFAGYYSDSVYEHIDDPAKCCNEAYRVLRPGGRLIINTNSVFNPFMFPNKFLSIEWRERLKRFAKIQSEGTYRAPYKINTARRLRKYLREAGFVDIKIYRWGVPAMYRPRWLLFLLLCMELLGETPLFCGLKHRLMATAVKPEKKP
jgi:SAM-dependent methyltransferase